MSIGLLSSLMNTQSQTAIPAGQQMQVVMIEQQNIVPNPDNEIYSIGDLVSLEEDIKQNGLRQPLEVIPMPNEPGFYMLISGHRRWMACTHLSWAGDSRFEKLPCLIRESQGALDDRIALITANATARDLTDGERLAQYEALKQALTEKKKAGQLEGKVRDELCKILSLSTGAAARLNVIASCENENIRERLKAGEIGLMEAYRYAQDYARAMAQNQEESEPKETEPETLPKNPDPEDYHLPPDVAWAVETLRKDDAERNKAAVSHPYQIPEEKPHPAASEETPRGYATLYELAKKTLKEDAPWNFEWEDVQFQLEYYSQNLPGGAKIWKRVDETKRGAGQIGADDYAIIRQDKTFFTCGWITRIGIQEDLTNYFELK